MEKMNKRMFIDVHVLQTVPPSCVNRDDTGSPKTAVYGGVTRARISSQSWKHAMREMFRQSFPKEELAYRTKSILELLQEELINRNYADDPAAAAEAVLTSAGLTIKQNKKTGEPSRDALFFISDAQVRALADLVVNTPDFVKAAASKEIKQKAHSALKENPGIDVALFGRMVAEDASLNTDACSQVAHAISTHRVSPEFDYFTAVDDLLSEGSAGASHIGTVEFNSSTLYRYATLAVHNLSSNLKERTEDAVVEFIRAFVYSMPTGKQNTFANRTVPDCLIISVRNDQPVNFVGAFEKPVSSSQEGYVEKSVQHLTEHIDHLTQGFLTAPVLEVAVGMPLAKYRDPVSFDEAVRKIRNIVSAQTQD